MLGLSDFGVGLLSNELRLLFSLLQVGALLFEEPNERIQELMETVP